MDYPTQQTYELKIIDSISNSLELIAYFKYFLIALIVRCYSTVLLDWYKSITGKVKKEENVK